MEAVINNSACKICGSQANYFSSAKIMGKYNIKYFLCSNCSFLFTEEPYWLEEAYKNPINLSDTGIISRNITFTRIISSILYFNFKTNATFLDYAGGYGLFTRMMRDIGFNFFWIDPYCRNIFANGFEYKREQKIDLLTAFECFEHFENPLSEIKKMKDISSNIIFSTDLIPSSIPEPGKWWYYGLDHGQHISFYSYKSLNYIANKLNLNLLGNGSLFMFTSENINNNSFLIIKKLSRILFPFIRMRMNPLTHADQDTIKSELLKK